MSIIDDLQATSETKVVPTYATGLSRDILDFPVKTEKVFFQTESGRQKEIAGQRCVVREDTDDIIALVSDKYELVPHRRVVDAVEEGFFRAGLGLFNHQTEDRIQTALNHNGARFFRTYHFPDLAEPVRTGDILQAKLRVMNTYDASGAVSVTLDTYRVFCSNLCASWGSDFSFSLRHIGNGDNEMYAKMFEEATHVVIDRFGRLITKYKSWNDWRISEDNVSLYLDMFALKNHCQWLATGAMAQNFEGTRWSLYNMMTAVVTHEYTGERSKAGEFNRIRICENVGSFMDNDKIFEMNSDELGDEVARLKDKAEKAKLRRRAKDEVIDAEFRLEGEDKFISGLSRQIGRE